MLISVVVCATRGGTITSLVNSILKQEYQDWELLILAQGQDPRLIEEVGNLPDLDGRIRKFYLKEFGKTKALNAGIKAARGEALAFTDDDCEAHPKWLSTIASCFKAEPGVGVVAGSVIAPKNGRKWLSTCPAVEVREYIYRPSELNYQAPPFFYFIGANYAVRTSAAERIGQFDEYLGPGGLFPAADETDFCLRAEALDIAMWTTPRSVIYHTYGRRSGVKQVIKHHLAYARSKGALVGKLELMNHRLAGEWSREPGLGEKLSQFIKNPRRMLLEQYLAGHVARSKQEYLDNFKLGPNWVSIPKSSSGSYPNRS
jgi:GT2 family glycosyltransferase